MKETRWNHRAAISVAVVLLLLSGLGYRVVAARLGGLSGAVSLPRGTLAKLSLQIGDWIGEDVPLDERIIQATDTDDLVNRTYVRRGGRQAVALFLAYGVHFRDLMPHRPEVCYPGAGWTLDNTRRVELEIADGSTLPTQIHRFYSGGLDSKRVTVLNYYDVDGRYCPDVSLLRSQGWRPASQLRYVAQIQITCPAGALQDRAEESVRAFAVDSAPVIRALLAEAVEQAAMAGET